MIVVHPTTLASQPVFSSSLSEVRSISLIRIVYIKLLFPFNKQFSIDSFLDWEGHYWVSTKSSPDFHALSISPSDHHTALVKCHIFKFCPVWSNNNLYTSDQTISGLELGLPLI